MVAYTTKPKAGYEYLATAAKFAAVLSTDTKVSDRQTGESAQSVEALVYYIDPAKEEMKIAYPTRIFDRNSTVSRELMCSILTVTICNNQDMGEVEYGKIYDVYYPPRYRRLGSGRRKGGVVDASTIRLSEACYADWQGGDFGRHVFSQMSQAGEAAQQIQFCHLAAALATHYKFHALMEA